MHANVAGLTTFTVTNAERTHLGQDEFYKSEQANLLVLSSGIDETWVVGVILNHAFGLASFDSHVRRNGVTAENLL